MADDLDARMQLPPLPQDVSEKIAAGQAELRWKKMRVGDLRIDTLLKGIARSIAPYLREKIEPLEQRITMLQLRVEQLEWQLHEKTYQGVYEHGRSYREHNSVTHKGAWWVCLVDTSDAPGTTTDWQLAQKSQKNR